MAESVYVLCTLTSLVCAVLLVRGYRNSRARLLFWSSLCFFGLAAHSALLFVDIVILPQIDLFYLRAIVALLALSVLLYGLIWEGR